MSIITAPVSYPETTASMQTDPEARHTRGAASESSRHRFPIETARCATSPEVLEWVPDRERQLVPSAMIALCRRCPSRQSCLEWAMAGQEEGYWAGTTTRDRRSLARADLTAADTRQGTLRQLQTRSRSEMLHDPGEASYGWYRKGCPCDECREANNTQRAGERERARQRRALADAA